MPSTKQYKQISNALFSLPVLSSILFLISFVLSLGKGEQGNTIISITGIIFIISLIIGIPIGLLLNMKNKQLKTQANQTFKNTPFWIQLVQSIGLTVALIVLLSVVIYFFKFFIKWAAQHMPV